MLVTMDTPPLYELGFLTILLISHSYDSTYDAIQCTWYCQYKKDDARRDWIPNEFDEQ